MTANKNYLPSVAKNALIRYRNIRLKTCL